MNCSDAREFLSSYFDDELSIDVRAKVGAHLEICGECARELSVFHELSDMAANLTNPESPAQLWQQLERELDVRRNVESARRFAIWSSPAARVAALAALLLVAVGIGWLAYRTWVAGNDHHDHLAVNFDHYLHEFKTDPAAAQQILLAKYDGKSVDMGEAAKQLGYQPVVARGLPDGYSLDTTFVMDMPCCKCAQCVCRRDDGGVIAVFEHDDDQPMWFGERPAISVQCGGKPCSIVQVDDLLAASWKVGDRFVTIIGARNVDEVSQLVAHFKDKL